jgi:hypothetical protein
MLATQHRGPMEWTLKSDDSSAVNRIDAKMRYSQGAHAWMVDLTINWKSAPTAPYFYVVTWAAYLEAVCSSGGSLGRVANAIKRADQSIGSMAV